MSIAPAVKVRPQAHLTVLRTSAIAANMVRVVAGGDGFASFTPNDFTDMYVKLHFLVPGVDYPEPVDVFAVRDILPREHWPVTRTYTVRWVDVTAKQLAIDFVIHGDEGLAGPWAATAQPGDRLIVSGPGGAYSPDPTADWHLFAGDESALPAISAAIEALPEAARGLAFLEVESASGELTIDGPDGVVVHWLHRDARPHNSVQENPTSILADAVAAAAWPEGRVHVFAHGERESIKALRDVFFLEHKLERSQVSLSGYWARGRNEDHFQAEKKEPIGKILP